MARRGLTKERSLLDPYSCSGTVEYINKNELYLRDKSTFFRQFALVTSLNVLNTSTQLFTVKLFTKLLASSLDKISAPHSSHVYYRKRFKAC